MKQLKITLSLLSLLAIHMNSMAQTSYSFTENWKERYFQPAVSTTTKTLTTSASPGATITINTSTQVAPVLPTQFGVNTTFRNGSDQRTRSSLYNGIITTMRFPAGSGSNTYFWDGNIPSSTNNYYDQQGLEQSVTGINGANSNYTTPDIFVNFKKDINGEPIVVVNYFYARYGTTTSGTRSARVQQAADYAAAFVRRMNKTLNAGIKYWEVGNECYGKWEVGYNMTDPTIGTVTGKEYGEDFRVFAQAMKAVDPTIKIGAVVKDVDDNWNAGVLPEVENSADFLSVHEYFTTVKDATAANILAAVSQITDIKTTLQSCVQKYTSKNSGYFPIAMTEFNARGPYNCSMLNGVFISQILGELIKNKYGLASLWVSEWNWNATENATHGFLAKADPEQDDYTPRPSYLPFYYYGKCFGDYMVSSTSNNSLVKTYASTFTSGHVGIVLINTSAAALTVKVNLTSNGSATTVNNYEWYEISSNTIEPDVSGYKKFYINTKTSTTTGGGPDLSTVKPYKATPASNSIFSMPAYSIFFIVATPSTLTSTNEVQESTQPFFRQDGNLLKITHDNFRLAEIYTASGQKMGDFSEQNINISCFKNGYYLIKARFNDLTLTNKFLKISN